MTDSLHRNSQRDIRVALGQNKLIENGTTRSEEGFRTVCSPAKNHNVGRKAFEKLPFPGRAGQSQSRGVQ